MSARTVESLHPATWASIQMQGIDTNPPSQHLTWRCGCEQVLSGKVWLCQYHEGYDDGAWAVTDEEDPDE